MTVDHSSESESGDKFLGTRLSCMQEYNELDIFVVSMRISACALFFYCCKFQ